MFGIFAIILIVMAVEIPVPLKYRWEGKWPKSQGSPPTSNGGDAFLFKNKTKKKVGATKFPEHHRASQAGMRSLIVNASGKRRWR